MNVKLGKGRPLAPRGFVLVALACSSCVRGGFAVLQGAQIGNDVSPEIYPGGGTGGGPVDGRLNVYVVDWHYGSPVAGAFVMLDDGAEYQGSTDEQGLITFRRAGLQGPVTLTCGKPGFSTRTMVGLDAANITLPLALRTPPSVGVGTCTGNVKGWSDLPPLPDSHYRLGFASYLLSPDLQVPRNFVEQTVGTNLYAPERGKSLWKIKVPSGDFGVSVSVYDIDPHGTMTTEDDTMELTHVGVVESLRVEQGQTLAAVEVPLVAASEPLSVEIPSLRAGTDRVFISIYVQLKSGNLALLLPEVADRYDWPVPPLSGPFAGGNYWVSIGGVVAGELPSGRNTTTRVFHRKIVDTSTVLRGDLLDLPASIAWSNPRVSFIAPAGANWNTVELLPPTAGQSYWHVTFVDPSASAVSWSFPPLPPPAQLEAPPAGKLVVQVVSIEVPGADFNDARFKQLAEEFVRRAQQAVEVDN